MPRARRLPAEDRKSQIIEAAREVFASQSYAKVGTADLAKAAGVSEPALYRYFSGKKELFLATLSSTAPRLLEIWQAIAYDVEDPLETLWSIGVHYYDHLQTHSGNMKLSSRPSRKPTTRRSARRCTRTSRRSSISSRRRWTKASAAASSAAMSIRASSPGSSSASGSRWT